MCWRRNISKSCFYTCLLIFILVCPLYAAEGTSAGTDGILTDEVKESILQSLEELKDRLEKDDSAKVLQEFMEGSETVSPVSVSRTLYGEYSMEVIEKYQDNPLKIHVHLPQVFLLKENTLIKLKLERLEAFLYY